MTARGLGIDLRSLKESLYALLITAIAAVFAGLFLGKSEELLLLLPGLIVLIPGAINTRGAIFAALGSRLSSSMHLGLMKKFHIKNRAVTKNIYATTTLNLLLSILLGIFAWIFTMFLGVTSISVHSFIFISVIGGIISGFILMFLTFAISFKSFQKGWDPDNITSPLITTIGDVITIPSLLFAGFFSFHVPHINVISWLIIIIVAVEMLIMFLRNSRHKDIVKQSFFILLISGLLSSTGGILVEMNIHYFVSLPILLVIFPAFIGMGGNIGNIFSSRISTKMHLGAIRMKFNKPLKREIIGAYILSIIVFPFIAVLAFVLSDYVAIQTAQIMLTMALITISGLIVTLFVLFISFFMGWLSYRFAWDPDNVIIPIVTGLADLLGIATLMSVLLLSGFL